MGIGQYYAKNGRNSPVANLVAAKDQIKSEIQVKQKTKAFADYLSLLNAISYPKKYGVHAAMTEGQMAGIQDALIYRFKAITKISNHITNITDLPNQIDLSDVSTYTNRTAQQVVDKFENSIKGQKTMSKTGIMRASTYVGLVDTFKEIQEKILNGAKENNFSKGAFDGAMELTKFEDALKNFQTKNPFSEAKELAETRRYYFKPSQIKNDATIRDIAKNLIYWVNFFSYNPNTTNQIGDIGEAMAQLAADITQVGVDSALQKGEQEIIEHLEKSLSGSSRTKTNGKVDISLDLEDIKKITGDKTFSSTTKEFSFDGYKYKIDFSYDADTKRQIKADVVVSDDIKLSVKNWGGMIYKDDSGKMDYKGLGSTYITNAIQRSCGSNILEDYVYAIQDNQITDSEEGAKAVEEAHELARLSLLVDIASGYSQKGFGGNANFLVINNRQRKEWIGIDLYDMILNSLKGKRTKSGSYLLELQTYHNDAISDMAWGIMNKVMKGKKGKEDQLTQASATYRAMVLQQLHKEKISAVLNNGSIKI